MPHLCIGILQHEPESIFGDIDVGEVVANFFHRRQTLADGVGTEVIQLHQDVVLVRATATAFAGLADVIETPTAELAERVREDVTALMNQVHNAEFDDVEGRYLAGIIAASAQLSLSTALSSLPVVEDS